MTPNLFSNWSARVFAIGLFLLPIAIIFLPSIPPVSLKVLVGACAISGAFFLALVGFLKGGMLRIPRSWTLLALWLVPLAYAVSALFSPSWQLSLAGYSLDTDTVFFMALLALSATVPALAFEHRSDFVRAFFAVLLASWAVMLFHLVRLFGGGDMLSFGLFTSPLFSLVGKWNDLAIFFGFIATLVIIALEMLPLSRTNKSILGATLAVSLFFVALVNFSPVWILLGILALGLVLYRAILAPAGKSRFAGVGLLILGLSIIGYLFSGSLGAVLGNYFGIAQIEARPSLQSTIEVGSAILSDRPLLGSGPNTFMYGWDRYRPIDLNQSVFWNADFTSGVGFIPTAAVTAGMVGAAAWVLFIVFYLLAGIRSLLIRPTEDQYTYYLTLSSFAAGLYLLSIACVYLPSPVLLMIGFAAIGMYIALTERESGNQPFVVVFRERPRVGFVSVLGVTLLMITTAVYLYGSATVFAANVYFERAVRSANEAGDYIRASGLVDTALVFSQQDRLYRLKSIVNVAELQQIVASADGAPSPELQQRFEERLGIAVESALSAVRTGPADYRNWQALGGAYQSVVPLSVEGAYESALAAFDRAAELNPVQPAVPFARAQLEIARGDRDAARPFIDEALQKKQDFVPALLLLAEIELQDGNISKAIERAEAASLFEPSNPVTKFQVGVLKFERRDYAGAREAFAAALALAPDYANARFFLGRVFFVEGDIGSSIREFTEVIRLNPDNNEVLRILRELEAGNDPFTQASDSDE